MVGPEMGLLLKVAAAMIIFLLAFALLSQVARVWIEARVPRDGKMINIDGTNIHYVDRGTGRPVVLIHGLSGQLRNFAPGLIDRLAARHRVILIDRPGSGYSAPRAGANTLAGQADVVAGLITALDLKAPLVVGHSLGGAVALNLALNHPDHVGALALIAPATQPSDSAASAFSAMAIPSDVLRRFVSLTFATPLGLLIFDWSAKAVFAPESMPADFGTKGGSLLSIRPTSFFAAGGDMVAIRNALPTMARRYSSLGMPTGILFGNSDQVLEPDVHGARLHDAVPGATLTQIEGGHMIVYTHPDIVADWILAQDAQREKMGRQND
jgi:pimeloyl-ACP methyl ester carboxylesterase